MVRALPLSPLHRAAGLFLLILIGRPSEGSTVVFTTPSCLAAVATPVVASINQLFMCLNTTGHVFPSHHKTVNRNADPSCAARACCSAFAAKACCVCVAQIPHGRRPLDGMAKEKDLGYRAVHKHRLQSNLNQTDGSCLS